jgi:hypothetical protein
VGGLSGSGDSSNSSPWDILSEEEKPNSQEAQMGGERDMQVDSKTSAPNGNTENLYLDPLEEEPDNDGQQRSRLGSLLRRASEMARGAVESIQMAAHGYWLGREVAKYNYKQYKPSLKYRTAEDIDSFGDDSFGKEVKAVYNKIKDNNEAPGVLNSQDVLKLLQVPPYVLQENEFCNNLSETLNEFDLNKGTNYDVELPRNLLDKDGFPCPTPLHVSFKNPEGGYTSISFRKEKDKIELFAESSSGGWCDVGNSYNGYYSESRKETIKVLGSGSIDLDKLEVWGVRERLNPLTFEEEFSPPPKRIHDPLIEGAVKLVDGARGLASAVRMRINRRQWVKHNEEEFLRPSLKNEENTPGTTFLRREEQIVSEKVHPRKGMEPQPLNENDILGLLRVPAQLIHEDTSGIFDKLGLGEGRDFDVQLPRRLFNVKDGKPFETALGVSFKNPDGEYTCVFLKKEGDVIRLTAYKGSGETCDVGYRGTPSEQQRERVTKLGDFTIDLSTQASYEDELNAA